MESQVEQLEKMNTGLVRQLREYLTELMVFNSTDFDRFAELQSHDKILNEYTLERDCGMPLFEWIRDLKEHEVRQTLQKEIANLQEMLQLRDNEIIELLLKLEDFELKFLDCDEANYQSGLSGSLNHLRVEMESLRDRNKDSISSKVNMRSVTAAMDIVRNERLQKDLEKEVRDFKEMELTNRAVID